MVKVSFTLHHKVKFGENIVVSGACAELGEWAPENALPLEFASESWEGTVDIDIKKLPLKDGKRTLDYKYVTVNTRGDVLAWEGNGNRLVLLEDWMSTFACCDAGWLLIPGATEITQRSSAFVDALRRRPSRDRTTTPSRRGSIGHETVPKFDEAAPVTVAQIMFEVEGLRVPPNAKLGIVGSCAALGNWNVSNAAWMYDGAFPMYRRVVAVSVAQDASFPITYKYIMQTNDSIYYEEGADRVIPFAHAPVVWHHDGAFRYPMNFTPADWRGAGIAVPVFSLRSNRGCGVGEFLDLIPLVDWAKKCGLKLIQVLPVNDSTINGTWWDSYPYSPVSSVALHPLYLALDDFSDLPVALLDKIKKAKMTFNAKPNVDYENVLKFKWEVAEELFKLKGKEILEQDKEFAEFFSGNFKWLMPYAVFCNLRYQFKTPDHTSWPKYSKPTSKDITMLALGLKTADAALEKEMAELSFFKESEAKWPANVVDPSKHGKEMQLQYFVQYLLHRQLKRATKYAIAHNVALKGDVTIGVDPWSVDCWVSPHLFNLDCETGAPPDAFSESGQNWGFPTYNWNAMEKENFSWWRQRLSRLAEYFQVVRLDHVIGFFRIWEIPKNQSLAMLGHFSPCIPVHRSELESVGLWDIKRLSEPYIRDHILMKVFHTREVVQEIKTIFLNEFTHDFYEFKKGLDNMKAIKALLASLPESAVMLKGWMENKPEELVKAFEKIVANVCFTKDSKAPDMYFHARLGCQKQTTYLELEDWQKAHIDRLHLSYLYHRQDQEWSRTVRPKLRMLKESSNMMICGEDLGMIPECVEGVLKSEAMLGVRLPRLPKGKNDKLDHPEGFPYLVVSSPSCHDLPTMRCWWSQERELAQLYFNQLLKWQGPAPVDYTPAIATAVNWQLAETAPMLVVYPVAELLAMKAELVNYDCWEEEINRPSVKRWFWKFRLRTNVEDLVDKHNDLSDGIYNMLSKTKRIME